MCALKLDTKSYDFSSLEKKYSGFKAPAFKISIEGKDIVTKEYMGVSHLDVENSIDKASSFSFSVINSYEMQKSSFKWVDNYLTVGKKVEIKLGYVDKFETVFEGYITNVKFQFSRGEVPTVVVSGMDSLFLLMKGKKSFIWSKKKHSDIVSEVAKKYGLKTEVTSTDVQFESVIQNQQTDYDFLRYLADLNSCEVFVVGTTLYFRKINSEKGSVIDLEVHRNLIEFEYGYNLGDLIGGVTVKGYNTKKEEIEAKINTVKGLESSGKDGISILQKLDKENIIHYIYDPVISKKEAEDRAKSLLLKRSMMFVEGEGASIGLPEIIAGRYINIKGIWGTKTKLFYITSVNHVFDQKGFNTHFRVGGNTI